MDNYRITVAMSAWHARYATVSNVAEASDFVNVVLNMHNADIYYFGSHECNFMGSFLPPWDNRDHLVATLLNHCIKNDVHLYIYTSVPPEQFYVNQIENANDFYKFDILEKHGCLTMTYVPHWMTWATSCFLHTQFLHKESLHIERDQPPKRLLCNFNHHYHKHRLYVLDQIFQQGLMENNLVTCVDEEWVNDQPKPETVWKPEIINPQGVIRDTLYNDNTIDDYLDCFMDLVCESNPDVFFVTEKTVRPIAFCQPFLCMAAPGYHLWLKEHFGLELFEELWDYSFDFIQDPRDRAAELVKQAARYKNHSMEQLAELRKSVEQKLLHNLRTLNEVHHNTVLRGDMRDLIHKFSPSLIMYDDGAPGGRHHTHKKLIQLYNI